MKTVEGKRCICGHVVEGHKKRGCRGAACHCKVFLPVQLTVDAEFERLAHDALHAVVATDIYSALRAFEAYTEAKNLHLPHVFGSKP